MSARPRANPAVRALPRTHKARWLWLLPPPAAQHLSGWALLPLRAFLGFTFCFAGLQKLSNPGFFDAHNPASIQVQIAGAARRSPIHALLTPLAHQAVLIGVVIAVGELAIGVGALLGLLTRVAAIGGLVISLNLFLAVSFHTNPYYTGSDIVFAFAWIPLIIAGGGQLSLDALGASLVAARQARPARVPVTLPFSTVQGICGSYEGGRCAARKNAPCQPDGCPYLARQDAKVGSSAAATAIDADRRKLVGALVLGAGAFTVLGGGLIAGLGRLLHTSSTSATTTLPGASATPSASAASPSQTAGGSATPSAAATGATPPGTKIGPASTVAVGGAASFQDPASGDQAIVIQPHAGTFLAFDAICPHAGCPVQYDQQNANFNCPCHGSVFNGATGAVEIGPARQGLAKITIAKGSDGQLYVT
jgi:thiosulfate dehydrogenase [quinone] large subunit